MFQCGASERSFLASGRGWSLVVQTGLVYVQTRAAPNNRTIRIDVRTRMTCPLISKAARAGMEFFSETAVEHLGLKLEKHPTPYRISWVNEENSVLVKHRCLVKFSLGKKYMYEAWCDVIPMIVCHVLLE
jgi:hypothetical protein